MSSVVAMNAITRASNKVKEVIDAGERSRIDDINDELLLKILERIPWIYVASCKAVCKRWCLLISNPDYIRSSLFTLILRLDYSMSWMYYAFTENPTILTEGFTLDFLPCYQYLPQCRNINIVTSYENFLICCAPSESPNNYSTHSSFYLCDPIQRKYVEIPPNPCAEILRYRFEFKTVAFGFAIDHSTNYYNYKLVFMHVPVIRYGTTYELWSSVYCSITRNWIVTNLGFSIGEVFDFMNGFDNLSAVTFRSKLHWVNNSHVLVFDPFLDSPHCRLIDLPYKYPKERVSYCIGVSGNHLRLSELWYNDIGYLLKVWKLEDFDRGTWLMERHTWLKNMKPLGINDDVRLSDNEPPKVEVVAFHPVDPNTLILSYGNQMFRCDVAKGTYMQVLSWNPSLFKCTRTKPVFPLFHPSSKF